MRRSFRRIFFYWPEQKDDIKEFIQENIDSRHIYFAVHLFKSTKATKDNAVNGRVVYADLDECDPSTIEPTPSIVMETSPGRYHGVWKLNVTVPPPVAADYSRRVAYKYSDNGADKSGWDIGQLLRVPYTFNHKYPNSPEVLVVSTSPEILSAETFEQIEPPTARFEDDDELSQDMPELAPPQPIFQKYRNAIAGSAIMDLYLLEPDEEDDWSRIMWRLIHMCLEAGMTPEETFSVCAKARCNKYIRDQRPIRLLWLEVQKANLQQAHSLMILGEEKILEIPNIAPEPASHTILDTYQEWATEATDALPVYHELSSVMVLSSLLSGVVRLETSDGIVVPNLWGMILGESTLTRKTTAMTMARDLIAYIDESIEVTSEASVEGLLQELSNRPKLPSMFFRDEVAGFLTSVLRKDYLSGMMEVMTDLYNAPRIFKRTMKSGVIYIQEPVFLFFGGGITEEVYGKLTSQHITTGFLPRFLFVSGKPDPESFKPTGPMTTGNMNKKQGVYKAMSELHQIYNQTKAVKIGNQTIHQTPTINVNLTNEAWQFYQNMERQYTIAAEECDVKYLANPTFGRLHRSCLKIAILLAAARQEPNGSNEIICKPEDVINAAYYIQRWGEFSVEAMYNVGNSDAERAMKRIRETVAANPGIQRSTLMRKFRLSKRQMDELIDTLLDRGEIRKSTIKGKGGGSRYWPT